MSTRAAAAPPITAAELPDSGSNRCLLCAGSAVEGQSEPLPQVRGGGLGVDRPPQRLYRLGLRRATSGFNSWILRRMSA